MKSVKKQKQHVLKIKRVPHEPVHTPLPPELPEHIHDLVAAVRAKEIAEIHFIEPEPTRWERLVKWFSGEDNITPKEEVK